MVRSIHNTCVSISTHYDICHRRTVTSRRRQRLRPSRADLWTVHTYNQNIDALRGDQGPAPRPACGVTSRTHSRLRAGQPYIVDEFGGIKWIPSRIFCLCRGFLGIWRRPRTLEEFYTRLEGMIDVLLSYDHICGYCSHQLTDVEQEPWYLSLRQLAGFDMARIAAAFP